MLNKANSHFLHSHPFSCVVAAGTYYGALELVREDVWMDSALGQDIDLHDSASVQSHTPCVALGKSVSLLMQLENSRLKPLGVLWALEIADWWGQGKCADERAVQLWRIPKEGMVCRIQPAALQKGEVLSVHLEITPVSVISSFCLAS